MHATQKRWRRLSDVYSSMLVALKFYYRFHLYNEMACNHPLGALRRINRHRQGFSLTKR